MPDDDVTGQEDLELELGDDVGDEVVVGVREEGHGGDQRATVEIDDLLRRTASHHSTLSYDLRLVSFHWLRVPERMQYKVAVLGYRVLHGSAPRYLGPLTHVADVPGRRTLRSAATNRLIVPSVKLCTVSSRAFAAAASSNWNSLPEYIVSASTPHAHLPAEFIPSLYPSQQNILLITDGVECQAAYFNECVSLTDNS